MNNQHIPVIAAADPTETNSIEARHARRVFGHGAKGPAIRPSTVQRAQALGNRR